MHTEYLISAEEFCASHEIEISFIRLLEQTGLIELETVHESPVIRKEQLRQLEIFINLHYELEINMEGIETITHLLQRMSVMHNEIILLRNRLRLHEDNQ
ncbi:MAG: MerR family transcriptional regulator [Bacteroidia bacterium]|nr:MAG: MerR family transcriptional regulator [Bacteroidia bacterium]